MQPCISTFPCIGFWGCFQSQFLRQAYYPQTLTSVELCKVEGPRKQVLGVIFGARHVVSSRPDAELLGVPGLIFFERGLQLGQHLIHLALRQAKAQPGLGHNARPQRSEERRVGKECRSRWSPY